MTDELAIRPAATRSVATGALVVLGIVGWLGLLWLGATLYAATPPKAGFDLELLLRAGRDVAAGRSPYDPALVAGTAPVAESLFYSYPPVVAQAMALFAPIPSPLMLLAWGAAAVAGLAAAAAALGQRFAPDLSTRSVVVPVVALAPLCFPFAIGLLFGNLDVFFPLLYGAMLLAVAPGTTSASQRAGGLALATASIAKLHPASLGVWFGTRTIGGDRASARVFLIAILVGIGLLAVSVVVWGITPWTDYLAVIRAGSNADLVDPRNAGPAAQLALLLGADDRFARTAQIGVTLAVIVVSVVAGRRGGDPVERFGWAAAASLATLPVTWFHYPSAMLPFGLVALLRSHGGPAFGQVRLLVAAALVVAALAIAFLPLVWLAIGLVLVAVRVSGEAAPTTASAPDG
jgi:Glycosyltransferase family 87